MAILRTDLLGDPAYHALAALANARVHLRTGAWLDLDDAHEITEGEAEARIRAAAPEALCLPENAERASGGTPEGG